MCIKIKWIPFLHFWCTLYSIQVNGQRYLCEEIPINIQFKGQRTLYSFTEYFVHLIYTVDRWPIYWTEIFNKNHWWNTSKQKFSWVWSPISFYIDSIVISKIERSSIIYAKLNCHYYEIIAIFVSFQFELFMCGKNGKVFNIKISSSIGSTEFNPINTKQHVWDEKKMEIKVSKICILLF